jgi:hypothetical protein
MLIRATLFLVLYLLVVKAGMQFTDASIERVYANEPETILSIEEGKHQANYLKAMASLQPGDPQRCQAIEQVAADHLQRLHWADAEKFYRLLSLESQPTKASSSETNENLLRLANFLTTEAKLQDAKAIYMRVLEDDRKRLPKDDLKIARDLNNMGLNSYLIASSEQRGDARTEELRKASDYYKQALLSLKSVPKSEKSLQTESVILANHYLALRDLNDLKDAELAKTEAKSILAQFKNPCSLP